MKQTFLIVACIAFYTALNAQVSQPGQVYELNSGNAPIAGVEILVFGALPADSDNDGQFALQFSKAQAGDPLIISRIYKKGYALVNETELNNRVVSASVPLKIILCLEATLDKMRRKYYDIGQDRYYQLYQEANEKLKEAKAQHALSQKEYEDQLAEIAAEYKSAMERLTYYADKFARINKDELNELDARAVSLMEEGRVEEAIRVYEEAAIVEQFREKTLTRDTASYNIAILHEALRNELSLLLQKDDDRSRAKADSIYLSLLQSDDTNFRNNADYAAFLMTQGRIDMVFPFLERAFAIASGKEEKAQAEQALQRFFAEITDADSLKDYREKIQQLDSLRHEKEAIERLKRVY